MSDARTPPNRRQAHGFPVLRGDVLGVDIGYGHHYYVVISNDVRNATGNTFLGARLTSRPTYAGAPTVAALTAADGQQCSNAAGQPMQGWVLCDRIVELPPPAAHLPAAVTSPTLSHQGSLTSQTMREIDAALRVAIF